MTVRVGKIRHPIAPVAVEYRADLGCAGSHCPKRSGLNVVGFKVEFATRYAVCGIRMLEASREYLGNACFGHQSEFDAGAEFKFGHPRNVEERFGQQKRRVKIPASILIRNEENYFDIWHDPRSRRQACGCY